jgi:hypothetical protein
MGVLKKGRHRINVRGRPFVWYVCDDSDSSDKVLHVIAEDKGFIVQYHLGQSGEPLLSVLGHDFPGVPDAGGCRLRFRCPRWETDSVVTPGGVRRLIEWCLSANKELIEVDWRGVASRRQSESGTWTRKN